MGNRKTMFSRVPWETLLNPLPSSGTIHSLDGGSAGSSYWCIQLDQAYQQQAARADIALRCDSFLQRHHCGEYRLAQNVCRQWADLADRQNANIQCVSPPSLAGLNLFFEL